MSKSPVIYILEALVKISEKELEKVLENRVILSQVYRLMRKGCYPSSGFIGISRITHTGSWMLYLKRTIEPYGTGILLTMNPS
jgi:hypothetical protein